MLYDISRLPSIIEIGYTGEEKFRKVQIDMSAWMAEMPNGVPSIVHIRPGETADDAYIAETTFANNILSWEITQNDLGAKEGTGLMQVWLEKVQNATLLKRGKSTMVSTMIREAINDPGDTIPPARNALLNLTAEVEGLAAGEDPTVEVEHDGYYGDFNLKFGIPKGDKGDRGDPAPADEVTEAVDAYLEENFTNPSNPPLDRTLMSNLSAAPADMVGNVKGALSSEDEVVNDALSLVNYGYDTPFYQAENQSSEASWKYRLGIDRKGQCVTLNKFEPISTTIYLRLSGEVALAGSSSGAQAWTSGITLITGHQYCATVKLISGTSKTGSSEPITPLTSLVLRGGETSSVGTVTTSGIVSKRIFTAEESTEYNICLLVAKNQWIFTNAKFMITLEDMTESDIHRIDDELDGLATKIARYLSLSSSNDDCVSLGTHTDPAEYENIDELGIGVYKVGSSTAAGRINGTVPTTTVGYRLYVSELAQSAKKVQIALVSSLSDPHIKIRWNTNNEWTAWKTLGLKEDIDTLDSSVVKITSQSLTDSQKAIARTNIAAADSAIVSDIQQKVGGSADITNLFDFTDRYGKRVNWKNGKLNGVSSSAASNFVSIEQYDYLVITCPIHRFNEVSGLAFYTDNNENAFIEGSGVKDDYDTSLIAGGYEYKEVTIPENAKYIRVTWWNPNYDEYDVPGIDTFSCTATVEGSISATKTEIPDYYFENGYMNERVQEINDISTVLGRQSFQCYFVTDYHKSDNSCVSPDLLAYLTKKTGIRDVIFGGDAITKGDSRQSGYSMLCDFLKDFRIVEQNANVYYITGNHEMNRPGSNNAQHPWENKLPQDVAYRLFNEPISHKIKCFDDTNTFYYDNDAQKIRVICVDCNYYSTVIWWNRYAAFKAMETTPEGYAVVIFSHVACGETGGQINRLDNNFTEILECAKAMNDGTEYEVYKSQAMQYSFNFSGHERTFIGVLSGHLHYDGYILYDSRFPVISVAADTGALRPSQPARVKGTITEQLFDAVQIDVAQKRIYCTRIGYGDDIAFSFGTGAKVIKPCSGITLNETEATMDVGDTLQLVATITPNDTDDVVSWESSDTTKATVSNGLVTVVGRDTSETPKALAVSIVASCGAKYAACTVTIPAESN